MLDLPADKLVWDVSHQAYVHKILTGRRDRFDTLRKGGGISGFAMRSESRVRLRSAPATPDDAFRRRSAWRQARDLARRNETVVAVLGDGALTGGLAYEALNNAGQLRIELHRHPQRQRDVDRAQRRLDRLVSVGAAQQAASPTSRATPARRVLEHMPLGGTREEGASIRRDRRDALHRAVREKPR